MGFVPDAPIRSRDVPIGCIGAGMIMAECHLAAYKDAGFPVVAIASRSRDHAAAVAARWGIPQVHDTPAALIADPAVAILDLAFPPDQQPALIRQALKQPHIKAILAQKPLSLTLGEAIALRDESHQAGKLLSVNQNMRYDQSMRVLKQILERGDLGPVVFAQIDMHAIPHWQTFLQGYDRLTLANMSVHHLDVLRFLFGEPTEIYTAARPDPRTTFRHTDGITVSTLKFGSGVLALSLEDVWSGPREEGFDSDIWIKWRVEGTDGVAQGTIVNLTDRRAEPSRRAQIDVLGSLGPDGVARKFLALEQREADAAPAASPQPLLPHLVMPEHHDVRPKDVVLRRLHGSLAAAADRGPADFPDLLMTPGVGPRTVQALAMVAEVVHGTPCRFSDPARFSFAHGGKDRHPYPVPVRVYDETIRVLKSAVQKAKLGQQEELFALRRLDDQARQLERHATGPDVEEHIRQERATSHSYGGRSIFGDEPPPDGTA